MEEQEAEFREEGSIIGLLYHIVEVVPEGSEGESNSLVIPEG